MTDFKNKDLNLNIRKSKLLKLRKKLYVIFLIFFLLAFSPLVYMENKIKVLNKSLNSRRLEGGVSNIKEEKEELLEKLEEKEKELDRYEKIQAEKEKNIKLNFLGNILNYKQIRLLEVGLDDCIYIRGISADRNDILEYEKHLKLSERLMSIYIQNIEKTESGYEFIIYGQV